MPKGSLGSFHLHIEPLDVFKELLALQAEVLAMDWENKHSMACGNSIAYGEEAFFEQANKMRALVVPQIPEVDEEYDFQCICESEPDKCDFSCCVARKARCANRYKDLDQMSLDEVFDESKKASEVLENVMGVGGLCGQCERYNVAKRRCGVNDKFTTESDSCNTGLFCKIPIDLKALRLDCTHYNFCKDNKPKNACDVCAGFNQKED